MKTFLVKTLVGIFLTVFPFFLFGQEIIDTEYFKKMNGSVSKVIETHYTAKENFGEVETDEVMFKLHAVMDNDLNLRKIYVIKSYDTYLYEYNADGLISKFGWRFEEDQKPFNFIRYEYQEDRLLQAEYFQKNNYESYSSLTLNYNLDILEKGYIMKSRVNYVYNNQGEIIEEKHVGLENLDCNPYQNYYESLRLVSEWLYSSYIYKCNSYSYRPDDAYDNEEYTKVVKIGKYDRGGSSEEIRFDLSNKVRKYEYDNHDNWVKCTHYVYDKPFKIIERKITYK